jgi:prepilin signal peptidase PulO-like enzyme (type II secretory pathway)
MIRKRRSKNYFALLGLIIGLILNVVSFHLLSEYKIHKHLEEGGFRVITE